MQSTSDLQLGAAVLVIPVKDAGLRLVDLNGDAAGLDEHAAQWLLRLLQDGSNATAIWMAQQFQVSLETTTTDCRQFVQQLLDRGFLVRTKHLGGTAWSLRSMKQRLRELAAQCIDGLALRLIRSGSNTEKQARWLLSLARLSVRCFGWTATVEAWKRGLPLRDRGLSLEQRLAIARDIDAQVRETASRQWFHVECKERGLTCWGLGRWLGVPVRLVIGFETAPFGGHCWAEIEDGSVISDNPEFCRSYQPVVRYS